MLPNKHEVAESIELAHANPYWKILRVMLFLTTGMLVIFLMDGIRNRGEKRHDMFPYL